jgi:EmrB/QacA subfamily drug resistance transporter
MTESTLVVAPSGDARAAENPHHARRWLILVMIGLAQLMVVLDATVVNIALPSAQHALGFSDADRQWVVTAYSLAFGGLLLLGGRAGDILGRRRVFIGGIVLFSVASLLGGFATTQEWLLAARALQGVGGAIIAPTALSLVTTNFPEGPPRNRAMAVYSAMSIAGGAVGLILGGVLTTYLSWRWVLFVNVPIGLLCTVLAPRLLVESHAQSENREFDIPGAVTVTAGLALLVYALVDAVNVGWGSTATIAKIAGAVALLIVFVLIEQRRESPIMPFSIFRLRTLRGANVVALLIGMSLFSMFFFVSLYMQQVLGFTPLNAGLSYLPLAIGIILSAGGASVLVTRVGFKPVLLSGLMFIAVGLLWFSQIRTHGSFGVDVLGPSLLAAIGLGLSFVPVTIAAVTGTDPHEAGLASGLVNTAQQVGGALGLAILATIANSRTDAILHGGGHEAHYALTQGFARAFLVGAGFALAGAVLTVLLISSRDSREHSESARGIERTAEAEPAG